MAFTVDCFSRTQTHYAAKFERQIFTTTWGKTSAILIPVILIPRIPFSRKKPPRPWQNKIQNRIHTPSDFVGLRAKMYSLKCDAKSYTKVKGIQKGYVKKHIRHECFLEVLKHR